MNLSNCKPQILQKSVIYDKKFFFDKKTASQVKTVLCVKNLNKHLVYFAFSVNFELKAKRLKSNLRLHVADRLIEIQTDKMLPIL